MAQTHTFPSSPNVPSCLTCTCHFNTMEGGRNHFFFFFFFFLFFFIIQIPNSSTSPISDNPATFVFAGCSQTKYAPNTPYQYNLNSLLASLANSASMATFSNFTSNFASQSYPVHGLYQCRGDLSIPNCHTCVSSAITQLSPLCSLSTSAALQLRGCAIRYGNDTFLGRPDETLLYRRCGAMAATVSNGYEADLVGMREGVLAGLVDGGVTGLYRVGRVGYVDGVAQCVGDLSQKECGDCVVEAVKEMRDVCGGPAVSGEVYLGKCYVVYEARGGDPSSSSSSSSSSTSTSSLSSSSLPVTVGGHRHAEEMGKQMAIIIGIAVAVLFLILLLYFMGKSAGAKGK